MIPFLKPTQSLNYCEQKKIDLEFGCNERYQQHKGCDHEAVCNVPLLTKNFCSIAAGDQ